MLIQFDQGVMALLDCTKMKMFSDLDHEKRFVLFEYNHSNHSFYFNSNFRNSEMQKYAPNLSS